MPGALDGFTIIDFTQGLCGPFASMRLADAGAEVIKIEPLSGDTARTMGPPFIQDESAVFLSLNRNKKSVALDVTTQDGREIAQQLIAQADVVLEDFGPGQAEHWGWATQTSARRMRRWCIARSVPLGRKGRCETSRERSWWCRPWPITPTRWGR